MRAITLPISRIKTIKTVSNQMIEWLFQQTPISQGKEMYQSPRNSSKRLPKCEECVVHGHKSHKPRALRRYLKLYSRLMITPSHSVIITINQISISSTHVRLNTVPIFHAEASASYSVHTVMSWIEPPFSPSLQWMLKYQSHGALGRIHQGILREEFLLSVLFEDSELRPRRFHTLVKTLTKEEGANPFLPISGGVDIIFRIDLTGLGVLAVHSSTGYAGWGW